MKKSSIHCSEPSMIIFIHANPGLRWSFIAPDGPEKKGARTEYEARELFPIYAYNGWENKLFRQMMMPNGRRRSGRRFCVYTHILTRTIGTPERKKLRCGRCEWSETHPEIMLMRIYGLSRCERQRYPTHPRTGRNIKISSFGAALSLSHNNSQHKHRRRASRKREEESEILFIHSFPSRLGIICNRRLRLN